MEDSLVRFVVGPEDAHWVSVNGLVAGIDCMSGVWVPIMTRMNHMNVCLGSVRLVRCPEDSLNDWEFEFRVGDRIGSEPTVDVVAAVAPDWKAAFDG